MAWNKEQKENILRHYESIEEYERINAIREAKKYLENTDYVVVKMAEYSITHQELDQDYTDILQERERARNIIRENEESDN